MRKSTLVVIFIMAVIVTSSIIPSGLEKNFELKNVSALTGREKIWYVGGSGSGNYSSIQDAIDNASSGETLLVYNGTYQEKVDVGKSLTIQSKYGPANCIVKAADPIDHIFEVTADFVNISGFTINDATIYPKAGIYLDGVLYCSISANIASNNYGGISLHNSSKNNIINNDVSNNLEGILLVDSNYNNITKNEISYNHPGSGISLVSSQDNNITNNDAAYNYYSIYLDNSRYNTIANNSALDNYNAYGIYLNNSSYNSILDNTAHDNYWGFYIKNSSYNVLMDNNAIDNYIFGIYLIGSNNNNVTDNYASHNFDVGIRLSFSNDNIIKENNVSHNQGYGIHLSDSSNNIIYNNYFNNTKNVYADLYNNRWNITIKSGPNIILGPYLGGNYWSDYSGIDENGDGIGDIPYNISGGVNHDQYPLVKSLGHITLFQGWNMITIPFDNTLTAEALGQSIINSSITVMFNSSSQTFSTHVVGTPWDDFSILDGVGYFVYCTQDSIFSILDGCITSVNVSIYQDWNIVGWYHDYPTNAEYLGENISGCTLVLMFDAETQTFITHVMSTPWDNFSIECGMAVFIYTTVASFWHGEG